VDCDITLFFEPITPWPLKPFLVAGSLEKGSIYEKEALIFIRAIIQ
jgi:hypothetical protein